MPFRHTILISALMPALLLAGCGSSSDTVLAEQVAIAKDAADRAVTAQKAAERAASLARAQSTPGSFGEDEIVEEIDDYSEGDVSDSSDDDSADSGPSTPPPR